jgi:orotate phosphoribosyltransferase-like protein
MIAQDFICQGTNGENKSVPTDFSTTIPLSKRREYSHPSYLSEVYNKDYRGIAIQKAVEFLISHTKNFDAVVGRGTSGMGFGVLLAYALKKDFVLVRKKTTIDDYTHSSFEVEGLSGSYSYLIVDDLICTGSTIRKILSKMQASRTGAKPYGIYLYSSDYRNDPDAVDGIKILNKSGKIS